MYTILFTYMFINLYTILYIVMKDVISVRVDKKVKKILEEAGVNISEEVRRFLEDLAWKIEVRNRIERFKKEVYGIEPAEKGFSAKSVREDREGD